MINEPHPTFDKKYECRVDEYHKCGCKPIIVRAASLDHADQIAGRCIHGNHYIAHKPSLDMILKDL